MSCSETLMLGCCCSNVAMPSRTSFSSAGLGDQPAATRLTAPLSALAALVFVLDGQEIRLFCGPLVPEPVPPLPPPPPPPQAATNSAIALRRPTAPPARQT